ncbi:MAG TPA: hypothetical protein VI653_20340 [Steroidobacteraceae bacterium]
MINSREALSPPCYRAAMMKVPPGGTTDFDADWDEDTIEMMLTPADVRLLTQAAEEQQWAEDAESPSHPPTTDSILPSMPSQPTLTHNPASLARGALAGAAGALLIVVAIASLSAARLTTETKPNPPPGTSKLVAATAVVPAAAPATAVAPPLVVTAAQPLRFKNPFDKSEVFEFPAGTTLEEARASVADLLRQRALDRHIRPGNRAVSRGATARRSAKQADIAQNQKRG